MAPWISSVLLLASACGSDDFGDDGAGAPTVPCFEESPGSPEDGCRCDPDSMSPSEIEECSPATTGEGLCCADPDYPTHGRCECKRWGCDSTCTCGFGDSARYPDASCATPGPTCCASADHGGIVTCHCSDIPCAGSEISVESCDRSVATCGADVVTDIQALVVEACQVP
jgi:hypothetical protein